MGNLSGEAKAPAEFFVLQLRLSAFHSASVGILYPIGQGLFTPDTPCHKLSGLVPLYQFNDPIRKLAPGLDELLCPVVGVLSGVLI